MDCFQPEVGLLKDSSTFKNKPSIVRTLTNRGYFEAELNAKHGGFWKIFRQIRAIIQTAFKIPSI